MLSPDFYTLNQHTEFPFPHDSCDHATDQELFSLLFGNYHLPEFLTKYYVSRLGGDAAGSVPDIIDVLRGDEDFVAAAMGYLRLKFVLEVLHVPSLMKKLRDIPLRVSVDRGDWFKAGVADERVWRIDCLATWLFNYMIRSVEARCAGVLPTRLDKMMLIKLRLMSTALQEVRAELCDGRYVWRNVMPYDLIAYPFISLVKGLWGAVMPMVTAEFAGLRIEGCSTVTGWSSPKNVVSEGFEEKSINII
jgi:hypothetical protein